MPLTETWAVWCGAGTTKNWPVDPKIDLTIVSVLRRGLDVLAGFVMRVPLKNQRVDQGATKKVWGEAKATLQPAATATRRKMNRKVLARHKELLPDNWKTQLAVCLDVPACHFDEVLVGGPLLVARYCQIGLAEAVEHLVDEQVG